MKKLKEPIMKKPRDKSLAEQTDKLQPEQDQFNKSLESLTDEKIQAIRERFKQMDRPSLGKSPKTTNLFSDQSTTGEQPSATPSTLRDWSRLVKANPGLTEEEAEEMARALVG